jgi:hypothetical protein
MTTATAPSVLAAVVGFLPRWGKPACAAPSRAAMPTRLLPGKARTIHAAEGLRLEVVSGRLWLTQPGASQDVFLTAGDTLALAQDWVVIEVDAMPDVPRQAAHAAYRLLPLA